jgi:hypothetical protein
MTTFKERPVRTSSSRMTLAQILEVLAEGQLALRFTAYDGSSAGPDDATIGLDLRTPRGTTYLATAPGELGMARAYVSGDLEPHGVHPGDPYALLKALADKLEFKRPPARVMATIVRSIGFEHLKPIAPPPQEALPRWRRIAEGLRHSKTRDAEAIHHHYDVSNTFYEWVLGPSMTYTCACYLTGSGRIITEIQNVGLEVLHEENLRHHYAMTLRDWYRNLVGHWDETVAEVGLGTAKVWGLYMAGSRVGFEHNAIQLHQVVAVKLDEQGGDGNLPLRPWWTP